MNVQRRNDVSIYCLSAGNVLPEWLGDRARRNLSKTSESVRRRVELLQDFTMPASSSKLVQSSDGRYIMAAGTYPPRIRCFDVHELSLKFERYVNASAIDMVLLGSDYGKLAMLLDDRTIAFHAHYGAHESIRIPTFGRAMAYEPSTCELLVAAKGDHVYRVNLDEGRFNEPWEINLNNSNSEGSTSGTCISVHPLHPLATVGCDDGTVRLYDSRAPDSMMRPFLKLDVGRVGTGYGYADTVTNTNWNEITCAAHDAGGLHMAFGTGGGLVALYDVRSSRPLHVQEHKHGLPIHTARFHASSSMILSSDEKLIKVWRYKSGGNAQFTTPLVDDDQPDLSHPLVHTDSTEKSAVGSVKVNIEGNGKFTHFIVAGDENDSTGDRSGLILCATDQPKMDSFYVPAIGVAPKWCSYLENITEELEERDLARDGSTEDSDFVRSGQESVFENYKFVTRDNLEQLGISNLVGTPLLRGYMHGFFMDINLYNRVKAVANPFEYEEYQKKKLQERLKAKQSSRIASRASDKPKKTKTAVNSELADRLENKATATTKTGRVAAGLLTDDRFGNLFTNPDYEIDQEDEDFKLRNPSGVSAKNKKNNFDSDSESEDEIEEKQVPNDLGSDEDHDEIVSDGDDRHELDEGDSESDEDGFKGAKVRGEAYQSMKELGQRSTNKAKAKKTTVARTKGRNNVTMYEADDDGIGAISGTAIGLGTVRDTVSAAEKAVRRRDEMTMPLAKRKAAANEEMGNHTQIRSLVGSGGSKEAVYIPRDPKQQRKAGSSDTNERGSNESSSVKHIRRGVKDLGFKAPFRKKM